MEVICNAGGRFLEEIGNFVEGGTTLGVCHALELAVWGMTKRGGAIDGGHSHAAYASAGEVVPPCARRKADETERKILVTVRGMSDRQSLAVSLRFCRCTRIGTGLDRKRTSGLFLWPFGVLNIWLRYFEVSEGCDAHTWMRSFGDFGGKSPGS